jgi:AbrB family looped-hinge helix DNA binding protein
MKTTTVTVSSKGQIALPAEMRKKAGIAEGEQLLVIQEGSRIMLEKLTLLSEKEKSKFEKLMKSETFQIMLVSEKSLTKFWDNEYDKCWDNC